MKKKFTNLEKALIYALIVVTISFMILSIVMCTENQTPKVEATALPTIESIDISALESIPTLEPEPTITLDPSYEDDAIYIAKTVYGEARGCSKVEQAAVIWCILNRVDSDIRYMPDDIIGVVTQRNQFDGYKSYHPVTDDIYELTIDVLTRWVREKAGESNVGRVLPKEYLYFHGDGVRNHFRTEYSGGSVWDWRLENPYEC